MEGYEFVPHAVPVCQPCPEGFFKAGVNNGSCVQCPAHSTTLTTGASVCHCLPGHTLSATHLCHKCPSNTFKSKLGNYRCQPCPLHSQGPPGSDSLLRCRCVQPRHYVSTDVMQCVTDRQDVNFHPTEATHTELVHEPKLTDGPVRVDAVEQSSSVQSTLNSGMMVAISISVAVVLATILGVVLSLLFSRRLPCHASSTLFVHNSESLHCGPEVTIDSNLVSYCSPEPRFHIRRLRIGQLIGRGAFGQVHAGLLLIVHDNVKKTLSVAVKRLKDKSCEEEHKVLQAELDQMILVGHHPNIIQLIGSCIHKGQLHIIMEMAEGGDLLTYLRQDKVRHEQYVSVGPDGSLREPQTPEVTGHQDLMLFVWHIAKGMSFLESVKCIHRDLAARNCLLTVGPVAKLSDFGLSRDVYESGYYFRRFKGRVPFKWLSPEAFLWGQYSSKSDVWSYGILLWEVATLGGTPYSGVPPDKIADMHRGRYRLPQPPACPDSLYKVMRSCWHEDPRRRPRFRALCDVMETFVQAATENKYLDLQGHTHPTLPDLSPETEQPPHPDFTIPYTGDVTSPPCSPHGHGNPPAHSAPYSNTPPHRPLNEKTQPLPPCRLPMKTRPLTTVEHSLSWGQGEEEAGDSGQHMDMSEEGMELQPMLAGVYPRWTEEGSGDSAALPWEKELGEDLRETYWTSGYSSSPSGSGSRLNTGDGKGCGGS